MPTRKVLYFGKLLASLRTNKQYRRRAEKIVRRNCRRLPSTAAADRIQLIVSGDPCDIDSIDAMRQLLQLLPRALVGAALVGAPFGLMVDSIDRLIMTERRVRSEFMNKERQCIPQIL